MTMRTPDRLNDRGISVVELLVGVTLLAVVVVALAASSMYASRTVTRSQMQLNAVEFQQAELERLLAIPYDKLATDARTTKDGKSSWTVVDSTNYRRIMLVTTYTPAEAIAVWDTVVAYRLK